MPGRAAKRSRSSHLLAFKRLCREFRQSSSSDAWSATHRWLCNRGGGFAVGNHDSGSWARAMAIKDPKDPAAGMAEDASGL